MSFVKLNYSEIFDPDRNIRFKIQGRDHIRLDVGERYMLLVREILPAGDAVYIPAVLYWILEDGTEVPATLEEKQLVLVLLEDYKNLLDPGLSIEPY